MIYLNDKTYYDQLVEEYYAHLMNRELKITTESSHETAIKQHLRINCNISECLELKPFQIELENIFSPQYNFPISYLGDVRASAETDKLLFFVPNPKSAYKLNKYFKAVDEFIKEDEQNVEMISEYLTKHNKFKKILPFLFEETYLIRNRLIPHYYGTIKRYKTTQSFDGSIFETSINVSDCKTSFILTLSTDKNPKDSIFQDEKIIYYDTDLKIDLKYDPIYKVAKNFIDPFDDSVSKNISN